MGRFNDRLEAKWDEGKFVCVGLDPTLEKIVPEEDIAEMSIFDIRSVLTEFLIGIINGTADLVCAFKPNTAFFEAYGSSGIRALEDVVGFIRSKYPDVPVILDAKRADIGNTNLGYVKFAFDILDCDAITVHPYMGHVAMKPFLDRADRGVIILVRTSNEGADEFQELIVDSPYVREGNQLLFDVVAQNIAKDWNYNRNCAVVVGATAPEELGYVRELVGDMPILIPGVGAQGGDLALAVRNGRDARNRGMIINASRSVLYFPDRPKAQREARAEVERMNRAIQEEISKLDSRFDPMSLGNDV